MTQLCFDIDPKNRNNDMQDFEGETHYEGDFGPDDDCETPFIFSDDDQHDFDDLENQ